MEENKKEYELFGLEWEMQIMRIKKEDLIPMLKKAFEDRIKLKKALAELIGGNTVEELEDIKNDYLSLDVDDQASIINAIDVLKSII